MSHHLCRFQVERSATLKSRVSQGCLASFPGRNRKPGNEAKGGSNWSLKNCGFISDAIFKNCTHAHKSLSNKTIIQVCWTINLCAWRQGESLASIVDSVFEESLVKDSSVNIAYIYWGSLWRQTCCSVHDRWQTSAQACTAIHLPFKKSDTNVRL